MLMGLSGVFQTSLSLPKSLLLADLPNVFDPDAGQTGLAAIDWIIVLAYAVGTIWLGWYFSRRQTSTKEYFVGSGAMNPVLIGVSLFATLLSTISYLSFPGEALGKGPVQFCSLLSLPFVFLIVGFGMLPVYMRHRVTSAYELLEKRLGLEIRLLGAGMFVILRLIWMALLVYLTAKALTTMIGADERWIPLVSLITGTVAVIYTSLGGLRAVVITDAIQTLLLYGGALTVIAIVTSKMGGFHWFPSQWHPIWDRQPIFPENAATRLTVIGAILSQGTWYVCTLGGDQTSVQRFMATKDAAAARRALAIQLIVAVIVAITLGLVGFALLGYFEANLDQLPPGTNLKADADDLFPFFISHLLPPGVSGLVIAAMFAAAMSSLDSGVNSITAVVMTDGLDRFGKKPESEEAHVRLARRLAFGIGLFVVILSSVMDRVPGNITAVTQKTSNLLATPIFGLFFYALFVPFASRTGVWIGTACGIVTAVLIAFSGPFYRFFVDADQMTDPVSFQWIAPVALAVNLGVGCLVSLMTSDGPSASEKADTSGD
ncbi:Sodium/glucose cotransporter [Thalassoglobus neptunius]|uniref:Sodium/glucose cotransporter n=1 Tax=Thalassoglobus neptunius TaxID=1938619 RepID=A0A5C5WZS7_9PLAN|nr:sodium/solute symporter [Thalassoglobus neptunius]TWT55425.1 Sodium/glucose cotransporter [Thalassoglobus neptunius]